MPKVTVILSSFNHGKYIQESIDSVLNQTFTDFELIIWDDASTDDSWEMINSYSDPRILSFRNEVNRRGLYGINRAVSEVAAGEYIAIHHSDDLWEPEKLAKQIAFLDANNDVGAVFTQVKVIDENGNDFANKDHFYYHIFEQENRSRFEWLRHFFIEGNCLCHPSVLIRRECYQKVGSYDPRFAQLPDFDMWIRLCLKYEIYIFPERLVRFRVRDNDANASGNKSEHMIRTQFEYYKVLQNYRSITSFEELEKVFPTARKYHRNEGVDMAFILGMLSVELKPFNFTQLFGLDLLFEGISDSKRRAFIHRLYDFDYKDFLVLSAQSDVFMQERALTLMRAYDQIKEALEETKEALEETKEALEETKEAYMQTKEALEETKEAYMQTKEALEETKEAYVQTKEALEETKEAYVQSKEELESIKERVSWKVCNKLGL